jgi:hypothetical protein
MENNNISQFVSGGVYYPIEITSSGAGYEYRQVKFNYHGVRAKVVEEKGKIFISIEPWFEKIQSRMELQKYVERLNAVMDFAEIIKQNFEKAINEQETWVEK